MAVLLSSAVCAGCVFLSSSAAWADGGSFTSSDPLLNRIWAASVTTARDMLAPGPLAVDAAGDPCPADVAVVILDGSKRDRCPYIGDEAVTGMTLLISTPSAQSAMRDEISLFAEEQQADGAIPASPLEPGNAGSLMLFDYPSYWVQCLYDYVLYTGDLSLASQVWPNLVALMNTWYPSIAQADGLLADDLGWGDYASLARRGDLVAYYNAGYALALRDAASVAGWIGQRTAAAAWNARAAGLVPAFNAEFFDATTGAYLDSPTGPPIHPQDGNAFAVLAGLASRAQARSALHYLATKDARPWGNTLADDNAWDSSTGSDAMERAFPFMGYFEVLARFASSLDDSAVGLIRREWGWMLTHGPESTMWEDIGPAGGPPRNEDPSWDHGWSSGAAPALTSYVLGVRPTSPGFATFVVDPHPGASVTSASGTVPTPRGGIVVSWVKRRNGRLAITVDAPAGERWANASH